MDDALISFQLLGPNNEVIQKLPNHPVSGNFSVRFANPGNLTFVFDITRIIFASDRTVKIEATFHPD